MKPPILFCLLLPLPFLIAIPTAKGLEDDFSGGFLDPAWEVFFANADNYSITYLSAEWFVSGNQLTVRNLVPFATGNYTADLVLRRGLPTLGDFQAEFDFEWDMRRPGSDEIEEHRKAVPRILLRLLDENHLTVAEAGLEDRIYSGGTNPFGQFVGDVALPNKAAGFSYAFQETNPEYEGGQKVRIVRNDGTIGIFFGDQTEPVLEKEDGRLVASVEMVFGRRNFPDFTDEFFGEARVNRVSVTGEEDEPPPPPPPPTPSERFTLIRERYDMNSFADNPLGNAVGWGAGNILMAYLAKFEATGDVRWLSKIQIHAEKIFANRADRLGQIDEVRGRFMPAWTSTAYSDGQHYAWLVHAGNFLFPVVRAAYLINRDSGLRDEFGYFADQWIDEAIEVMEGFEEVDWHDGPGLDEGHFKGVLHPTWMNEPLPFNMLHTAGRTYVALWLATGEEKFRDKAERLARFWRNRMTEVEDRFFWTYSTYFPDRAEDISHGAISVDFAFQAYRAGIFFSEGDIDRLAQTLRHLSRGEDGFVEAVDGTGSLDQSDQAHRWLRLAYLHPDLLDLYELWFSLNWNAAAPLQMVLAAAYMTELEEREFAFETPLSPLPPPPAPQAPAVGFSDRFDRPRLFRDGDPAGPQWFSQAFPSQLIGARHELADGSMRVTAVNTTAAGNFTADVRFQRPVVPMTGDFSAGFDFGWDMTNPILDNLIENRKAMPRILVRLLGPSGETIAEAGLEDQTYSGGTLPFGQLVAGVNIPGNGPGQPYPYRVENPDHIGDAVIQIIRRDGMVEIFFNGAEEPAATGFADTPVTSVEMVFGRRQLAAVSDDYFGLATVREVFLREPGVSFEDWRQAHFSPPELANPDISGPSADPGGRGIPNLLRFAFGLDPREPSWNDLPRADMMESPEGDCFLTLTYLRANTEGVEVKPHISHDLVEWIDGSASVETAEVNQLEDGREEVILRLPVDCLATARQFLRLAVRLLP